MASGANAEPDFVFIGSEKISQSGFLPAATRVSQRRCRHFPAEETGAIFAPYAVSLGSKLARLIEHGLKRTGYSMKNLRTLFALTALVALPICNSATAANAESAQASCSISNVESGVMASLSPSNKTVITSMPCQHQRKMLDELAKTPPSKRNKTLSKTLFEGVKENGGGD